MILTALKRRSYINTTATDDAAVASSSESSADPALPKMLSQWNDRRRNSMIPVMAASARIQESTNLSRGYSSPAEAIAAYQQQHQQGSRSATTATPKESKMKWGKYVWHFFHMIAEKVKDDKAFQTIRQSLFHHIIAICATLPCPLCSQHAQQYLSKVVWQNIRTKHDFQQLMFQFHNTVNERKKFPVLDQSILEQYQTMSLMTTYRQFVTAYGEKTPNGFRLSPDTIQKNNTMKTFHQWFRSNAQYFEQT